jgi:hypothetical protein
MGESKQTFPCHRSVPKDLDRAGWTNWHSGQTLCAGGLIFAEKQGAPNAPMRYGLAAGWYDPLKLVDKDLVFDSFDEMVGPQQAENDRYVGHASKVGAPSQPGSSVGGCHDEG